MNNLNSILNELQLYKHNKAYLLPYYVNKRLNKSLKIYYDELSYYIDSLKNEDIMKIMKNKR